jgi:SRP-independent targeting protein 2/TMEM208
MLYGHVLSNLLPLLIRIVFRWQAFRQSKKAITFYCIALALSQFLYQYLKKMGTPKRDSAGNLLSPGDDLNHPGMTEWIFDILYISCEFEYKHNLATHILLSVGFAQVGSAIVGEWFWWIYLVVLFPLVFLRQPLHDALPSDSYICDLQAMEHTLAHAIWSLIFRS